MDKNNNNRIALTQEAPNNVDMTEETADALFAQATSLAYQNFPNVTDDHIEHVYLRLIVNHQWGVGDAGAVTVH